MQFDGRSFVDKVWRIWTLCDRREYAYTCIKIPKQKTARCTLLKFIGPWIANIFAEYNQQDAMTIKHFIIQLMHNV